MTKVDLLTKRINDVPDISPYVTKAKENVLASYLKRPNIIEKVSREHIQEFDFVQQVNSEACILLRMDELRKCLKGLERHKYAPELNSLFFKNGFRFRVSGKIEIIPALRYAAINMLDKEYADAKR